MNFGTLEWKLQLHCKGHSQLENNNCLTVQQRSMVEGLAGNVPVYMGSRVASLWVVGQMEAFSRAMVVLLTNDSSAMV